MKVQSEYILELLHKKDVINNWISSKYIKPQFIFIQKCVTVRVGYAIENNSNNIRLEMCILNTYNLKIM